MQVPDRNEEADRSLGDCVPGGRVDCDEAVRQLYTYLDGELTDERRIEIAEHLDLCGPCAGAVGFEYELRLVIASRCQDRVPQALIDRIGQILSEERDRVGDPPPTVSR
jgi:mycothiol system anti-sigma-R factor